MQPSAGAHDYSFSRNLLGLGLAVSESHIKFLGASNDCGSLASRDVLGNFSSKWSVVHQKQFNVFLVSNEQLSEATGKHMSSLVILLASDLGHTDGTSESSTNRAINTSRLSPGLLNSIEAIRLESVGVVNDLLHNFGLIEGLNCHFLILINTPSRIFQFISFHSLLTPILF